VTARSEARERLYAAYEDPSSIGRARRLGVGADRSDEQADTVSDVWEPLLRDALRLIQANGVEETASGVYMSYDFKFSSAMSNAEGEAVYLRIKEALG